MRLALRDGPGKAAAWCIAEWLAPFLDHHPFQDSHQHPAVAGLAASQSRRIKVIKVKLVS